MDRIEELSNQMGANLSRDELYAVIRHIAGEQGGAVIEHYVRNELQKTEMRAWKKAKGE